MGVAAGAVRLVVTGLCILVVSNVSARTISPQHRVTSLEQLVAAVPSVGMPDRGFVTSNACRSCHPQEYASWHVPEKYF